MHDIIDLRGTWRLCRGDSDAGIPAQVPGEVYGALLAAERIPNPFVGRQEEEVQWVAECDWEYRRTVEVPAAWLDRRAVLLEIDSLDTVAEVRLGGVLVARSDNMFLPVVADVGRAVRAGDNELRIRLRSPVKAAAARARKQPLPVPWSHNNRLPHMNLLRKVQCHAGWDWGICLATSGIDGVVRLRALDLGRIAAVTTSQRHHAQGVSVEVAVAIDARAHGTTELRADLAGQHQARRLDLRPGRYTATLRFEITDPELWWPAGYGAQPLYDLTVRLDDEDVVHKRIGLRTLELVDAEDAIGRRFLVRVNGVDVFCKGANWIPADAIGQRCTPALIHDLLADARAANMNMIRVWGGGRYEQDAFYDACDAYGLLVWQDLMFACSLYPADDAFLASCRAEVTHQVTRLRDHPCIALWCGDNELHGALGWYPEARERRDTYLVWYDRLNRTLAAAVGAADPTRTFWPSSPCNGPDSFDGWHDDTRGDMHYWQVWHGSREFAAYYEVTPRFCSEFGFQSFPSRELVATFAPADQHNVTSPVMEHHQRNVGGNQRIVATFGRYFRMPAGFDQFLYLSQVQQALAIKTAVEYWRHLQPVCMGALYWQLNDNWPVASWSSIEYGGGWKQLHYHARRFFQRAIAVAIQRDDEVAVHVVTEFTGTAQAELCARIIDFSGTERARITRSARIPAQGVRRLWRSRLDRLPAPADACFLELELRVRCGDAVEEHRNTHFFVPYKSCDLASPEIRSAVVADDDGPVVELSCEAPAFFVTCTAVDIPGRFDDNSITLLPGETRRLRFLPRDGRVGIRRLARALRVEHLRASY